MKFFNAIQVGLIVPLGPILIPMLTTATFFAAIPLMWILAAAWLVIFVWNIYMIYDQFEGN